MPQSLVVNFARAFPLDPKWYIISNNTKRSKMSFQHNVFHEKSKPKSWINIPYMRYEDRSGTDKTRAEISK